MTSRRAVQHSAARRGSHLSSVGNTESTSSDVVRLHELCVMTTAECPVVPSQSINIDVSTHKSVNTHTGNVFVTRDLDL